MIGNVLYEEPRMVISYGWMGVWVKGQMRGWVNDQLRFWVEVEGGFGEMFVKRLDDSLDAT